MSETPIVTINVEETQHMHEYSQPRRKYSTPHQEEHSNHYHNSTANTSASSVNKAHLLTKRNSSFGQAFNNHSTSKQQQTGQQQGQVNGTQTSQHIPSVSSLQFLMGSSSLHPQNAINNSNTMKALFGYLKGNKATAITANSSNHSRIANHNSQQEGYRDLLGKYYSQQQKQQQNINAVQQQTPFEECITISSNDLDQDTNASYLQQRQDNQKQQLKSSESSSTYSSASSPSELLEQLVTSELTKHREQMQQLWSHSSYSSQFMDPIVESQLASSTKQLQRANFTNYQVDVTEQDNHTPLEYLKQFRIETGPPRSLREQAKDINDNLEEYTEKLYFAIQERAAENLRKIGQYGNSSSSNNLAEENGSQSGHNRDSQSSTGNTQTKQQLKQAVQSVLEYSESRTVVPRYAREGDWLCHCGNLNFSYRNVCNKCQDTKGKFMLKKTSELSQQLDSIQKQLLSLDSQIMSESNSQNQSTSAAANEVMVTQSRQIVLSDFIWICRCCRSVNYAKTVACICCNMHKVLDAHRLMQISQHSQKKLRKYYEKIIQKRGELIQQQLLDEKNQERDEVISGLDNDDQQVKMNNESGDGIIDVAGDEQEYPQIEIAIDNGIEEDLEQLDTDEEDDDEEEDEAGKVDDDDDLDDERRRLSSTEEQDASTQENSISDGGEQYYYYNNNNGSCHSQNDNDDKHNNDSASSQYESEHEVIDIESINSQQLMQLMKKSSQKLSLVKSDNSRIINQLTQNETSKSQKKNNNSSKKHNGSFGMMMTAGLEGTDAIIVEDE